MPHRKIQTIEAHGVTVEEYRYEPELEDRAKGAEIINAASNPMKASRFLVTLVQRFTGEEKLLDLLIDGDRFTDVATEIRNHYDSRWEIFEWFDPEAPF